MNGMTDITELALIAKIKKQLENFDTVILKEAEANALVEALEKARAQSSKWLEAYHKAVSIGARYEERIAELEFIRTSADQVQREFAEELGCAGDNESILQAIDDLKKIAESRTVTVKLPQLKMLEDYLAEVAIEERKAILIGVRMEFHRALTAAGIKWEGE